MSTLCIEMLPIINIPPSITKSMSTKVLPRTSRSPVKRNILFCKNLTFNIVDADEELFFTITYIDGSTFTTTFVCSLSYNDTFTQSIKRHIRNTHRKEIKNLQAQQDFQPTFQVLN